MWGGRGHREKRIMVNFWYCNVQRSHIYKLIFQFFVLNAERQDCNFILSMYASVSDVPVLKVVNLDMYSEINSD